MTQYYRIWHFSEDELSAFGVPIAIGRPVISNCYYDTYPVLRETPKGVWLDTSNHYKANPDYADNSVKFVLFGKGKRFAHPTLELAHQAYIRRTQAYIRKLNIALRRAEKGLALAQQPFESHQLFENYTLVPGTEK